MRKLYTMLLTLILTLSMLLLVGCGGGGERLQTKVYEAEREKVKITMSFPAKKEYRWSMEEEDFRTTADVAILIGPDFKIAIQTRSLASYDNNFAKLVDTYETERGMMEVEYGGNKGFAYYRPSYNAYVAAIPIESNPQYFLNFFVYTEARDLEEGAKIFLSDEVQGILRTIELTPIVEEGEEHDGDVAGDEGEDDDGNGEGEDEGKDGDLAQ